MSPRALILGILFLATNLPNLIGQTNNERVILFEDDFSRYPAGWLSQPLGLLNPAIQEYHYLPHRGVPLEPWANAIIHLDAWVVSDEDGEPYIEQHLVNPQANIMNPIFITGEPEWTSYTVEVLVKPLSLDNFAGLVFRYHTNRHYYLFALDGGRRARLALRLPLNEKFRQARWRELASAPFNYDVTRYYRLRVENNGPHIRAFIDDQLVLEASDSEILAGKAGITANIPARFKHFRVWTSPETARQISHNIETRQKTLRQLQAQNPRPILWRRIFTPGFGAGRNLRFGDLDGDGQIDILIAQNIPRVRGDAFDHISCLTAITLNSKILWQIGKPDPRNGLLTNDTPFQIHDVDGDGKNEVVLVRDFKLQILDGATGRLKRWTWMPPIPQDARERPYELNNGDSIAFVNFSGNPGRHEILVKDRYRNFWIFDNNLKLLWHGRGQLGHYPFPIDYDADGYDELFIGYSLWTRDGSQLWSHDAALKDHADALAAGNFSGQTDGRILFYASGSDEGFLVFNDKGEILKHHYIGHAQSLSIGNFRPDLPGLEIVVVNFWKNPGLTTLFDYEGNILAQAEPVHHGTLAIPVNWRGDGEEFFLLSGNVEEGGLMDGHFRRVVRFPNDGHPDLTYHVMDLTGDSRDEIILWNEKEIWIYTQDRPFEGSRIYAPKRLPLYNDSNYRAHISLPAWKSTSARAPASATHRTSRD